MIMEGGLAHRYSSPVRQATSLWTRFSLRPISTVRSHRIR